MAQPIAVGKHIVLRKVEVEQKGIIVRVREEQSNEGEIVSVGGDVTVYLDDPNQSGVEEIWLRVGDVVVYNGGRVAKVDDEDFIIVKEEDILAVTRRVAVEA